MISVCPKNYFGTICPWSWAHNIPAQLDHLSPIHNCSFQVAGPTKAAFFYQWVPQQELLAKGKAVSFFQFFGSRVRGWSPSPSATAQLWGGLRYDHRRLALRPARWVLLEFSRPRTVKRWSLLFGPNWIWEFS